MSTEKTIHEMATREIREHLALGRPLILAPEDVKALKKLTGLALRPLADRLGMPRSSMLKCSSAREPAYARRAGRPDMRITSNPDSVCSTLDSKAYAEAVLDATADSPDTEEAQARRDAEIAEHLEGYTLDKASTLYGPEGEIKLRWAKHSKERKSQAEALRAAVSALHEEIPRAKPETAYASCTDSNSSLLSCYVLTDLHLGMMAWEPETGADYDLRIAEELTTRWLQAAVQTQPAGGPALLAQLGDFLHFDSLEAVTPTHGHILDADTRFQLLIRVAIRLTRRIVRTLLQHHSSVKVVWAEGNHDPATSVVFREMLAAFYEEEPRVEIDTSPDIYYAHRHGNTALFFHHGHRSKVNQVDSVMASKFRRMFGECDHAYCHTGHLHHREKETLLMIVEQHRTLAAKDAHASRGGYASGRSAPVILYHSEHGEVARSTISADAINREGLGHD